MQRLLGNAATAQLLGSSRRPDDRDARRSRNSGVETRDVTVQRDVGFEIEVPGINTRAFSPPPETEDDGLWKSAGPDWAPRGEKAEKRSKRTPPGQARLLTKGTQLVRADTFTIESDEAPNQSPPSTDLEFVTVPFPETDQGAERLAATVSRILAVAELFTGDRIHTAESLAAVAGGSAQRPADLPPNRSGARPYTEAAYVAYGFGTSGNPQATAGIRLDRVERLVRDLTRPEGRGEGPTPQQEPTRFSLSTEKGATTLSRAQQGVDRHVRSVAGSGGPDPDPAPSAKLRGLLVVIAAYLLHGAGRSEMYYKGIAPLMGRTDFGRMFTLLEPDERRRLAANDGGLLIDLALGSAGLAERADEPVLLGITGPIGAGRPVEFTELTRRRWLREITLGHDLLSKHGYEGYASLRTGEGFEHHKGAEFESMGSLRSKTEDVHGVRAPILELRRLPSSVPRAWWAPLLLQVFNAVRTANAAPHDD